jgi:hypothetical protein
MVCRAGNGNNATQRFFESDVTSVKMVNHGNIHKEVEQVKMWLQ